MGVIFGTTMSEGVKRGQGRPKSQGRKLFGKIYNFLESTDLSKERVQWQKKNPYR